MCNDSVPNPRFESNPPTEPIVREYARYRLAHELAISTALEEFDDPETVLRILNELACGYWHEWCDLEEWGAEVEAITLDMLKCADSNQGGA